MALPGLVAKVKRKVISSSISADDILNALGAAVVVVDDEGLLESMNLAAEQVLQVSSTAALGRPLSDYIPSDSPLTGLIEQARRVAGPVTEYDVGVETPRIRLQVAIAQAVPMEEEGHILLSLTQKGIADAIDRQLFHRDAARSVSSMAAMLAHEIRNPLSGIRGAAQLLEASADEQDKPLAKLIRDEADRISALIGRMEVFSDEAPFARTPVNIHQVIDRVERLAENGFGSHIRFKNQFDPSLPAVPGDHDQLVQLLLNLVKNAVEACPQVGGEITLKSAYQHGVRFAVPGQSDRVHLPLIVSIIDNGVGIPEEIQGHLFEPFVTTKQNGTGLGLALVAKLIQNHGGVVECDSRPGRTEFKVMLPVIKGEMAALSANSEAPDGTVA